MQGFAAKQTILGGFSHISYRRKHIMKLRQICWLNQKIVSFYYTRIAYFSLKYFYLMQHLWSDLEKSENWPRWSIMSLVANPYSYEHDLRL